MTSALIRPVGPAARSTAARSTAARSAAPRSSGPRRAVARPAITTPKLAISDKPAAAVLRIARLRGPIFRDDAAAATGLSVSTVNRQVSALLAGGLLRERADLTPAGAIGRPRLPFELNHGAYLTLGIHIGFKTTSITTHDLFHRVVGAISIATPTPEDPVASLTAIGLSARAFLDRWRGKRVLGAGVAIGGHVGPRGVVDHPRLGWHGAPVGDAIARALGVPVAVASHVEAMAAAELLLGAGGGDGARGIDRVTGRGSFLYVYAREMVGIAFVVDGSVYHPAGGPPVIGHFPVGATTLLDPYRTGQLEGSVSDTGIVAAARRAGLGVTDVADVHAAAKAGDETARTLLIERAEALGRAVAFVSDIFNPDHIVLGGQAFTDAPWALPHLSRTVSATSVAGGRDVRVSRTASTVQQQAAGAVSLDAVYSDPIGTLALTA